MKCNKLLKTIQEKDKLIQELKRRCKNIGKRIKRIYLKKASVPKCNIEDHINQLNIHDNAKTFCKMLTNNRPKNQKWPEEEKNIAQNIYYRSTSSYQYLRENLNFNLPSKTSVIRWQPIKYLNPGFNGSVLIRIQEKMRDMEIDAKQAVLIFDEIHIKSDLIYNSYLDQIDGFEDLGDERQHKLGKLICCFMIRGITSNWKFVLSYFVSEKSIASDILFLLVRKNLEKCNELGISVRAMVCD